MIPAGWEEKTLVDVLECGSSNLSANKLANCDGEYPVYGASGLVKKVNFYQQQAEYLAIIKDGAGVGRVYHYGACSSVLGTLQYLFPKSNINIRFAYYFLSSIDYKKYYQGAAIPHIYYKDYKNEKIILPPLQEQQRIVKKLDELFADIDAQKQIVQQNLQNAKGLFEAFTDKIFEHRHNDWEITTLGKISKQKQSKGEILCKDDDLVTFAPMEYLGINCKYLKSALVRKLREVKSGYTYFAENDILMAKITPCFENGKIGIAKNLTNGIGFGSSEYIVFRPSEHIDRDFLYYFLNRESFRKRGARRMQGAVGHKRVAKDFIANYTFQYPADIETQRRIVQRLDLLREQTQELDQIYTQQIADLDELKQAILKKAFNGDL